MTTKILIVDDEESIRFTFKTFLDEAGYQVTSSSGRDDALKCLEKEPLDLVFSDILLPDGSGLDILRFANHRQLACPVVMITGQPAINSAAESVRMGAYDYLLKPVRKADLLKVTRSALRHKQLLDEKNRIAEEKERFRKNLEAVFRSVQDAIITVSNDGRVLATNAALHEKYAIEPAQIDGRMIDEIVNPCLRRCCAVLEDTLSGEKIIRQRPIECRLEDDSRRVLEVTSAPLLDQDKKTIGATLVIRDNTRVSDLEEQLRAHKQFSSLIGNSPGMVKVYKLISALAATDATVLVTGESGTGKSLVAQAIHRKSSRTHHQMMTVHCSALVEDLLESELFGHVKGAFTGAVNDKMGRFEACHEGSIFLDEIGEISPKLQLKLLRVLQEKELERVGTNDTIKVDVRIIAATNRELRSDVSVGRFREDLYYRLNVVEIKLPPLRDRREDIPLLARHFCERFGERYNNTIYGFTDDVMNTFMNYAWPGNVRELEHAIEHAFVLCPSKAISLKYIPREIREVNQGPSPSDAKALANDAERLMAALRRTDGNKAKAARLLGISRQTLYRKLRRYNI